MKKEEQFIKILNLRKLAKKNIGNHLSSLMSKFGLLFLKYELLQNLCYSYRNILFIQPDSSTLVSFNILRKKLKEKVLNIQSTNSNATFVEQIDQNQLLVSGGEENSNRLDLIKQKEILKFSLCYQRQFHRSLTRKDKSYILSGNSPKGNEKCEVFYLSSKKQKEMNSVLLGTQTFGTDLANDFIFLFGGYGNKEIQIHDLNLNQ